MKSAPPSLGAHSRELLEELGYQLETIQELVGRGIVA